MSIIGLLSHLRSRDIKIWVEKDHLRFSAPKGAMTEKLRKSITDHKSEIIAFLHKTTLKQENAPPPISRIPREQPLPLSFAQQRLWFIDQFEPDNPLYNLSAAVRLEGSLNVEALEYSLNEIIRRHEILRTRYLTINGQPFLDIQPEAKLELPVRMLGQSAFSRQEEELRWLMDAEARRPFDLSRELPLRTTLLRIQPDEHIFLLIMHHIVSDGWSLGIFVQEMASIYDDHASGRPARLPKPSLQYADFAHWQRQWLQGELLGHHLTYWKEQLDGIPSLLDIPSDRPRPSASLYHGRLEHFRISKELTESLKSFCLQEDVTLFMVLFASFNLLLYRYSGQVDICIGTPIANRNRIETERMIGFFANTLVLRTRLDHRMSFRQLLQRIRETTLDAYAHQDVPFEAIVDQLRPERHLSYTPVFQTMFVLQNVPQQKIRLADLDITLLDIDSQTAKFDLTLCLTEDGEEIRGFFEYSTQLFDAATVSRMAGHFNNLLRHGVAASDCSLGELPMLGADEYRRLMVEWNQTATTSESKCVHHLFEDSVQKNPDAVALVGVDHAPMTYEGLNRRANQLAHRLRALGVGPEKLAGICVERSPEMIVGLLGILKAGGAYVPLDPTYPPERLAYMIEDSGISVLLTQQHLLELLPNAVHRVSCAVVCLDSDWPQIAAQSPQNPKIPVGLDNLAYVIYTSGSTGKPKGTLIAHRGVVNLVDSLIDLFDVDSHSRVLQFASFGFDASVTEIFPTFAAGACIYLASAETLMSAINLPAFLKDNGITTVTLPPTLLSVIPADDLPGLKTLVSAGEACSWDIVRRWAEDRKFLNGYGPTETTVAAAYYQAAYDDSDQSGSVPIGRPIANTQLYVLDQQLHPVAVGIYGQLHVGGISLARGYLARPAMTAEKFIPDPFSELAGARMYRTGDLVRYRPDGNIEFLGRIDNQVKLRGYRIELGEIEAALTGHSAVSQAAAVVRQDPSGYKQLVAYVVLADGSEQLDIQVLRDDLSRHLPHYIVPSVFVYMERLPLTVNGKVDRAALPLPDRAAMVSEAGFVAPRNAKEQALADIWRQLLGIEQVGVHDNFFELGGDSILSIQVVSRANQAGLRLRPRQLFEAPTIAGLAAVADTGRMVEAEQGLVTGAVPLTPIQRWFFELGLPEPHHWNQSVLLEVSRPLDVVKLEQALGHLLIHHDALRLRFKRINPSSDTDQGGWAQFIADAEPSPIFEYVDLSPLLPDQQVLELERRGAQLQGGLDIHNGPLLRAAYFDLGPHSSARLLIVIHHLAVDGVSWRILLEDLQAAYEQLLADRAVQLAPKTTSFQYWARQLEQHAQSEQVHGELKHWRTAVQKPTSPLPLDHSGGDNVESSAVRIAFSLTREETRLLLEEVPAAYGTDINDVLLTAMVQTVSHWTGSAQVLFELEGHGRYDIFDEVDLSRTVGWFTNAYPVRLTLQPEAEVGQTLLSVKEQLRSIPGKGLGYGLLRYLRNGQDIASEMADAWQPEISFNYLGQFDRLKDQGGLFKPVFESRGPERCLRGNRSRLLSIDGGVADGRLQMHISYSQNFHHPKTIEHIGEEFQVNLRKLIDHCTSLEAGGYSPSDFPDAELSQEDIAALEAEIGEALN